ncbi:MAG: hypothetical protein KGJ37_04600, partial [Verrucomicrobiota bacterium]|nr:hypothetical protein [Verrucomicrobiota bacterium]
CLALNADINLYLSEDLNTDNQLIAEYIARLTGQYGKRYSIGLNGEFSYVFAETEAEFGTSWVLIFYGKCAMIGLTAPKTTEVCHNSTPQFFSSTTT